MGVSTRWMIILLTITFCRSTEAQTYANYSNLVTTVLTGYNTDIIPIGDHSQTLMVSLSGILYSLMEVDVVLSKITVVFSVEAQWVDSQIQWTPSAYGNLNEIYITRKNVWTPSFVLATPVDFTTLGDAWIPVSYLSNGSARMSVGDVLNSQCSFNLKFWPFDEHVCDVSVMAYGYPLTHVRLTATPGVGFTTNLIAENMEWTITEISSFSTEARGLSEIVFRLNIKRRSGIFIILILFPLYAIGCMSPAVLLLPSDSGERIGFSTTLMLSLTVFLEVISDYIPNTSNPIPVLCLVVTVAISMSIICTLAVIVSLYFYHKDDNKPLHRFQIKFVQLFNRKCRKQQISPETNQVAGEGQKKPFCEKRNRSEEDIRKEQDEDKLRESSNDEMNITWKDLSVTIDRIFFMFTLITHTLMTIIFTMYLTLGSN